MILWMINVSTYSGEQGSPTAGSGRTLLILELTRERLVDFGASARFWTVLRAQKELGIHIWRFSGPDIFFSEKHIFFSNFFLGASA